MNPRLTRIRKAVLKYVDRSDRPVNVKTIMKHLEGNPDLSTVYRALDHLVKNELVQSLTLGRSRYFYRASPSGCGHFLSCMSCHEIVNIDACISSPFQEELEKQTHYKIQRHILFFEGICPDCQVVLNKRRRYERIRRQGGE